MSPRPPSFRPVPLRLRSGVLGASALALAACSTLQPPLRTELPASAAPAAWSAAATAQTAGAQNATPLALWWQRFNDPMLTTLVTQALQANLSVQSAQAALHQARAQRDVQVANTGPALGVSASAQRSHSGSLDASHRFQAGFDASWEPDVFGANRSAVKASEADARAAETNLAGAQVALAAEVAAAYVEWRSLQARLDIARRNEALQADTLQITRWRAQAGLVSSLEVEQAVAATEQTRSQIPALQGSATQALNALAVLTGTAPGSLQAELVAPAIVPQAIPQAAGELTLAFPADTLRQRPDVRTAEHRVSAAWARVDAAQAARYPNFRLSGSLGLSALTLGGLTSGGAWLGSLLASVSAPLFDGGAAKAQVRAQEAALTQTRLAYQATVLTALKEVEDALVALQADRTRLGHLQAAASAAVNAELLARQRYQSGLVDFRTVLDTQRSLLSAQDSVTSVQAALGTDHVRLYKALGGGWVPTESNAP